MKACRRELRLLHSFLTLLFVGDEQSASCYGHFTSYGTNTWPPLIGGWMGRRANMGVLEKR
jgi:hypothetical protein